MLRTSVVALALSTGVILSGSALAELAKFDGTWSVSLVANGGLCGSGASSTLMVSERQRAGRGLRGERVGSGWAKRVGQPGAAEERGPRQRVGQAVGFVRLRLLVGSSLGCSGHWTARRA